MQPLGSVFRNYVAPDVAHVAEAAEALCIGEFELFRLAHRWWHQSDCDETLIDQDFGEYLTGGRVPPWVRHYCRRVLLLASVNQLDPGDFGVEKPSMRRFSVREQRFASIVTLLAFLVYWMVLA